MSDLARRGFQIRHKVFGAFQGAHPNLTFWYPRTSERTWMGLYWFETRRDAEHFVDVLAGKVFYKVNGEFVSEPMDASLLSIEPFDHVTHNRLRAIPRRVREPN